MITLDQIRQLDAKVRKAVERINDLKNENSILKAKLDGYEKRIEEFESLIDTFKQDQGEIENGIINALNQLDMLEDKILPESDSDSEEETESIEETASEEEPEIEDSTDSEAEESSFEADSEQEPVEEENIRTESELDIF
eukprot:Anaeramoba_ignava/a481596_5.p1 GENE.a481596_5~~a481596_5.p1  ORF type:complete len:140 (-),score=25.84 a481596_5:125-544(-)